MNTEQRYKVEDLCMLIVTTLPSKDGKGSDSIMLRCERELTEDELSLIDEVVSDTLRIGETRSVRVRIDELNARGYTVMDTDGVTKL